MKHKQKQKGFTLIELMIVVAIIGILAAIAIPSYQDYTARAQVSEAVTLAAGFKTGIAEYAQSGGNLSDLNNRATAIGNTTSGRYVSTVELIGGTTNGIIIQAKMSATSAASAIRGQTLRIETADGGQTWECGAANTSLAAKHRPTGCK